MINLIILFTILPSTLLAETFRLDDPHFVDLVPASFNDTSHCRSTFDQSNPLKCKTHVEECDYFSEVFTKVQPFQIKKNNSGENLFAQVEGFDYTERGKRVGDKAEFSTISAPAKLKVYSIFREYKKLGSHNSFASVWDVDYEMKKEISMSPRNDFRSVKIDFSKLNLKPRTPVYLFGQSIGDTSRDEPFIINLTPGTYNLVFTFGFTNAKANKIITIPSTSTENLDAIVLEDNKNSKELGFNQITTNVTSPFEKSSITRFLEAKKISLIQNHSRIDVSNLFKSSPDNFLGAEKEDFGPKLIYSPAKLEIKGSCKVSEFKPQSETIPIYSDKTKKKKAGELIVSFNDGVSYQYIENGKSTNFTPNIYNGYCLNSEGHFGVQRVIQAEDNFSDLGDGPWGKHGWIEIFPKSLFSSDFIFFVSGPGAIRISPTAREDIFKFDYYEREGQLETEVREIKRESLVGPDGTLKVKIDCESGC